MLFTNITYKTIACNERLLWVFYKKDSRVNRNNHIFVKGSMFKVNEKLAHLTGSQIDELYEKYLNGEKCRDLILEYNISVTPNSLVKILPPKINEEITCKYCEISMYSIRRPRPGNLHELTCLQCNHSFHQGNFYINSSCWCNKCRLAEENVVEKEQKQKQKAILNKIEVTHQVIVEYGSLTIEQKVLLLSFIHSFHEPEFQYIQSINDFEDELSLAPTFYMSYRIIEKLADEKLIFPHTNSELCSFNDEGDLIDIEYVKWIANIGYSASERFELLDLYELILSDLSETNSYFFLDHIQKLIYELCVEESLQYIDFRCLGLDVSFHARKKTTEYLTKIVNDFPVTQIYYFANKAVQNAHLFYAEGKAQSKNHAGNTIPEKLINMANRALSENWNVYEFVRPTGLPRSTLSFVIFDLILDDKDAGFKFTIKDYLLSKKPNNKNIEGNNKSINCPSCFSLKINTKMTDNGINISCIECGVTQDYKLITETS